MKNQIYGFVRECNMPVNDIVPMKESPFKVRNDKDMKNLVESIRQFGVLEPLTVRKTVTDLREEKYEIVSGNRRYEACKQLGIRYIPVRVVEMMKDAAIIAMIDSNLCHRESILPSEKAAAYKMRLEAMKRQGYRTDLEENPTSTTGLQKLTSVETVANETGDSRETIRKYIRLTDLTPELSQLVDDGKIALKPAVEISYLTEDEQRDLLDAIDETEATPSHAQAIRMRSLSSEGKLDTNTIRDVMNEQKANQKESVNVPTDTFSKYVKGERSPQKYREFVLKAIEYYCRHLERTRGRDR